MKFSRKLVVWCIILISVLIFILLWHEDDRRKIENYNIAKADRRSDCYTFQSWINYMNLIKGRKWHSRFKGKGEFDVSVLNSIDDSDLNKRKKFNDDGYTFEFKEGKIYLKNRKDPGFVFAFPDRE